MKLRGRYRLVFAILLFFALIAAIAPDWLRDRVEAATENPSLDTVHAISQGLGLLPSPKVPVTLVRVDDQSFADWHRPFPFRKAIIARLVDKARQGKALAILVDLDISAATTADDAQVLGSLLDTWLPSDPPLLFPRELSRDGEGKTRPLEQNDFDKFFTAEKPLFWVNVLFEQVEDLKIRNWNLWERPQDSCEALLAPPLLSYAYQEGGAERVRYAQKYLAVREKPDCAGKATISLADMPPWLASLDKNAPIQFSFPLTETAMSGTIEGSGVPALIQLSAYQFNQRPVAESALLGRFVIIGNSYADNGDFHDTPIGEMEGMRVIANAVANSPNAIEANSPWKTTAVVLMSMLLGGVVASLTFALKPLIACPLALGFGLTIYSICNMHWGPIAAQSVVENAIVIWVLAVAFESLESICRGLFVERRRWRSFLNG